MRSVVSSGCLMLLAHFFGFWHSECIQVFLIFFTPLGQVCMFQYVPLCFLSETVSDRIPSTHLSHLVLIGTHVGSTTMKIMKLEASEGFENVTKPHWLVNNLVAPTG